MITDKKCSMCRRAGEKLFLKGEKCFTPKCIFVKKPYPPGKVDAERKHRSNLTEYGIQLREKQKVRNTYGVSERQFSNYIKDVSGKGGGNPGEKLYELLERRLDNIVFRMGLARSRSQARQLVAHGHITVNGRKSTIPSHRVEIGDIIEIREGSKSRTIFGEVFKRLKDLTSPEWLKVNPDTGKTEISALPKDREKHLPFNLSSVIEFYSR